MNRLGPSPALQLPRLYRRLLLIAVALTATLAGSGCLSVTVYQPQRAIHRPVLIEPAEHNFTPLRILVRCHADDDDLPSADAAKLCNGIVEDFKRQGAKSESVVPSGKNYVEPEVFDGRRPHLTVEIKSRIDHSYDYPFSQIAAVLSLTLIPGVEEYTFSQKVVVFGADGSVLAEEVFRERFVEYFGVGVWSVNTLMNFFVRTTEEEISSEQATRDFTNDFYGQLRQMTFNAKIRSETLGITPPTPSRRVVKQKIRAARDRQENASDRAPAKSAAEIIGGTTPPPDGATGGPPAEGVPPQDTSSDDALDAIITVPLDVPPDAPIEEAPPAEPPADPPDEGVEGGIEGPMTLPGELELPESASVRPSEANPLATLGQKPGRA